MTASPKPNRSARAGAPNPAPGRATSTETGTGNTEVTERNGAHEDVKTDETTEHTKSTKKHEEGEDEHLSSPWRSVNSVSSVDQSSSSPLTFVPSVSSVLNPVVPVTLNPIQAAFLACTERFSFYVGGIGAGKTTAGALRAIARATQQPGSLGLIGAPTYPMLRDATMRTFFELLPETLPVISGGRPPDAPTTTTHGDGKRSFNKTEMRLQLENGSEILFRSLDEPDRVRGLNLAWFWLDEAPLAGYYAWQILKGRLRQRGYEQETMGWATGTPHGRDGFWRDFEHAPRPHHVLFRAATQANAAHLPPDYISDLGLTGALYEQEVLGLFTAFEGLVYAFTADQDGNVREHEGITRLTRLNTEETKRTKEHGEEEEGRATDTSAECIETAASSLTSVTSVSSVLNPSFSRVIGGVDWGYTHPTAALVFGLDGDGRAWQLDEFYQRRAPLDAMVLPAICELTRTWGVSTWYGGPDEPEHLVALQRALLRDGLSCRVLSANNSVRPGIQTVTRLLSRRDDGTHGLYVSPRCVHTIAEYGMYQWEPEAGLARGGMGASGLPSPDGRGAGGEVSETPLKQCDDAMDATRYALHTALGQSLATDTWLELWLTRRR